LAARGRVIPLTVGSQTSFKKLRFAKSGVKSTVLNPANQKKESILERSVS